MIRTDIEPVEQLHELPECFEEFGMLSAPPQPTTGELKAWDSFNTTTAGTITGKVAPLGGTWSGAGDAVGFTVDTTNHWITREEVNDATANTGYYARLGTATATASSDKADIYVVKPSAAGTSRQGVFLRYTDVNNWLLASYVWPGAEATKARVRIYKRVSGTVTELADSSDLLAAEGWRTLELSADAAGLAVAREGAVGSNLEGVATVTDTDLATGGALASGGFGIYDALTSASVRTRRYDNFFVEAFTSTPDAVIFPSQKAQLTTQGMYRLDSGGSAYAPVSRVIGDLPRLPAGNLEGRSTELFIKNSAGDMDEVPDSSIPDLSVKVYVSRSWLTLPGTI